MDATPHTDSLTTIADMAIRTTDDVDSDTASGTIPWYVLAYELWGQIMSHTDAVTACMAGQTCRVLNQLYKQQIRLPLMGVVGDTFRVPDRDTAQEGEVERVLNARFRCLVLRALRQAKGAFVPAVCVAHVAIPTDDPNDPLLAVLGPTLARALPSPCQIIGGAGGGTLTGANGDHDPIACMEDLSKMSVSLIMMQFSPKVKPIVRTIKQAAADKFDRRVLGNHGMDISNLQLSILFEAIPASDYHNQLVEKHGTKACVVGGLSTSLFRNTGSLLDDEMQALELYSSDADAVQVMTAVMDVGSSSHRFERKLDFLLQKSPKRRTSIMYRVSCVNRHNDFIKKVYKATETELYNRRMPPNSPSSTPMCGWFCYGEIGPVQAWMVHKGRTAKKLTYQSALEPSDNLGIGDVVKYDCFGNTSMYTHISM